MPRQARAAICALALALLAAACGRPADTLRIAATTSVDNSGLLEAVLPAFTRETGVEIHVIATGSGRAINIARRGDVAALITHEPIGERALFGDGLVRYYRKVMFNRFVIAGPPGDPAGVAAARSLDDAMRRIAASTTPFVSRGDRSGTHVRELALWDAAGVRPAADRLIETGQGMGPTLRIASERQAYVLTDEATLAQLSAGVALEALFLNHGALINTYAVAVLTTARAAHAPRAEAFARWLAEGDGQRAIGAFQIDGRRAFAPWPPGADASRPEALPEARR